MRKSYLLLTGLVIGMSVRAQTFSDDFESYSVGAYLAASSADWTTWSGTSGGADDVMIVDDNANSGTKSVYFASSSTSGGPADVVLPFGAQYTTGTFEYAMMMFVESGKGAYYNFQAQTTVGQQWALECSMNQDGDFTIANTDGTLLTGSYPTNQWFEMAFEIDLDQNEWVMLIDGVSAGSFSNTINAIASIDIFPVNGTATGGNGISGFWVDDVSYVYSASTLPNLNAAVIGINPVTGLAGQTKRPVVTVRNLGNTAITSFDIEVDYNGNVTTESVTGVNLASYDIQQVEFTTGITLVSGNNTLTATITNVNGNAGDDDPADDSESISVDPLIPGLNKMVLVEEATGTWCGWCPRGAVWMAYMQENYPLHFVGIAVHNSDPMVNDDYDAAMGNLIGGYPSALVDRGADIDPSQMEGDFLQRVVLDATGVFCQSATYDDATDELSVSMQVVLQGNVSADWKVAMALTESGVTGAGTGWAQANYYSGGASGNLSGAGHDWHLEPNPVPASEMIYDHVARLIAPSFDGMSNSFPGGGNTGDTFDFTFTATIESDWNMDNMHLIGILIDENGQVDNAFQSTIDEALAAECVSDTATGIANVTKYNTAALAVYPNPVADVAVIRIKLGSDREAAIVVRDVMGRVVLATQVSDAGGMYDLHLDMKAVNAGMYVVESRMGGEVFTAKFLKQ